MPSQTLLDLELDLECFQGPFDLLVALVLREEVDLLEIELADVVVSYLDILEARGELELEPATEFLVLIAALLELKSRLMLPGAAEDAEEELEPAAAAEELVARMVQYLRYKGAAQWLVGEWEAYSRWMFRSVGPPPELRRARLESTEGNVLEPASLGEAVGKLLRTPPPISLDHLRAPRVTVAERLEILRDLLRARGGVFAFEEAIADADTHTICVTVWALLELYKRGEAGWEQAEPFGPITVSLDAAPPEGVANAA